ncbi:MAG: hypothetical protein JW787_01015 [Sedimentisphaerales bacterium]|nr:hypothetical protein [Sedimentisphaerales bacterium]
MNARDKSLKHSEVVFFTIMIICSFAEPLRCEQQPVQVGQWIINGYAFDVRDDPGWSGTAKSDNNSHISIYIYKDPNRATFKYNPERNEKVIVVDGIGEVLFNTCETGLTQQSLPNPNVVDMLHSLNCIFNQQGFTFIRTQKYTRESGSSETRDQFVRECIEKVLKEAPSDPLVLFAKLFFSKEIKLDQNLTSNTIPVIEASINNSEYIELKASQSKKGGCTHNGYYNFGWILLARPGKNVKFRVQLDTYEMVASTYGITTKYGSKFSQGRKISIDGKQSIFKSSGITELDYGNLDGPELLILRYLGWKDSSSQFNGNIYLRWGRPEEEWLDNNNFLLAERVTNPTTDNCIENLLHDLNIAFDWDRDCWIVSRGEDGDKYYPDYRDISALEDLDMTDYSQLNTIEKKQVVAQWLKQYFDDILYKTPYQDTGKIALDEIRSIQESLFNASGLKLWEKMVPYKSDEPSGWHNPFEVYMLAYLWKEYPELQQGNPIKKVLDFWFEAMKENPDPVEYAGKTSLWIDDSIYSRAYAIASLNLGYELFKKTEYKEACNVQIKRFREYLQEKGILDSIQKSEGWVLETDTWHYSRSGRQMCEAVSLYGQVCALIGDKEGLKQAQNWIKTALTREGTQGQNPFRNYESATFKDRCGFIAVLRGKSTFSELPLKKDVLLN